MKKLLIAENSSVFTSALCKALDGKYQIQVSSDGPQTLTALETFQPDYLVINLMLPITDGLAVLQQTAFRPRVILATTPYLCSYVVRSVTELGVDFTMIAPSVKALIYRLEDLVRSCGDTPDPRDLTATTIYHLQFLHFSEHLDGYQQLCIALPLFAQNPKQRMSKDLYPQVAKLCGCGDARSVEHSIRNAICDAWSRADPGAWRKYFHPGPKGKLSCPSNKSFICHLAQILLSDSGVL